jgi:hypothetical protein
LGRAPNGVGGAAGGPGDRVEVRSRFDGHWARGFVIASKGPDGYRVQRVSDGSVLPAVFSEEEIRPERHRQGMWWY